MTTELMLAFVLASALLSIAPGPDNLFVLTQSALYGKASGLMVTLGLCTGLIVHTTAVALGVAAIFQTSVVAFTVLKLVGAAYLLYLAWLAFRTSTGDLQTAGSTLQSRAALYRRGIVMNITNPKVSIFFLAFLPQFASSEHGSIVVQMFVLGGVFIVVAWVIFSLIALLAGELGGWLQRSPGAQTYLNRIAGTVYAALAIKLVSASADGH